MITFDEKKYSQITEKEIKDALQFSTEQVIRDLPEVMKKYGIADGDMVRVSSPVGSICGIAAVYLNSQPGIVHVYHGNAKGEANDLIDKNYLDPISGFPGYKSYFCKIEKEKGEVKA